MGKHRVCQPKLKFHPLALTQAPMSDDDFGWLCADVKKQGVLDAITLYEGKILDGRYRYLAALRARQPFKTKEFKGDWNAALALVFGMNNCRRHLSKSQQAAVYAELDAMKREREAAATV